MTRFSEEFSASRDSVDSLNFDSNQPYDPPPGAAQQGSKDPKIARIQEEIDSTKNVMRSNLESLQERGESLGTLEDKTNNLSHSAQGFRRGANKVRKTMWWKDMKMRIIIGVGIAIIVLVIVLPIIFNKN